jgi:hypothetical protein
MTWGRVGSMRCRVSTWRARVTRAMGASVLVMSVLAACGETPLAPLATPDVLVYRADQQLPTPARLDGELIIQRTDGERFEGRLDVRRALPTGAIERFGGFVRGRRDSRTISFEFAVDGSVMRHVGETDGSRHTGTWIDEGALGGSIVSGAFTLEPRS